MNNRTASDNRITALYEKVIPGRIAVVGGQGSGKTTLGAALSKKLGYRHMDIEDYYFHEAKIPYSCPRTREEVIALMEQDAMNYPHFVISAVNCDLGPVINAMYEYVIYLKVPLEIRLKRVRQRAYDRFGSRVLEGGDMYEQEQAFFRSVAERTMEKTDHWVAGASCPVVSLDGTRPIQETIGYLMAECWGMPT